MQKHQYWIDKGRKQLVEEIVELTDSVMEWDLEKLKEKLQKEINNDN